MTEQEWLDADDPALLVDYLLGEKLASGRKMGHWLYACARRSDWKGLYGRPGTFYVQAHNDQLGNAGWRYTSMREPWTVASFDQPGDIPLPQRAALLREILGNPFCPVVLPGGSTILTPDVLSIAARIYDTEDYTGMPVLADALEEAGMPLTLTRKCPMCLGRGEVFRATNAKTEVEEGILVGLTAWFGFFPCARCSGAKTITIPHPVLSHLREQTDHCRGCWAIDLILGKG